MDVSPSAAGKTAAEQEQELLNNEKTKDKAIMKMASSGTLLVTQEKGRQIEIDLSASSEQLEKYVEEIDNKLQETDKVEDSKTPEAGRNDNQPENLEK